jgi:hypothetical protein
MPTVKYIDFFNMYVMKSFIILNLHHIINRAFNSFGIGRHATLRTLFGKFLKNQ